MKLNRRVGDTLNMVKIEYDSEYRQAANADIVGAYLHALCSYYNELIGKNVSLSNPIEFACKYYRLYLQGLLEKEGYYGDHSLVSIYTYFNNMVSMELASSKIRQKEIKSQLWKQHSTALLNEFMSRKIEEEFIK